MVDQARKRGMQAEISSVMIESLIYRAPKTID